MIALGLPPQGPLFQGGASGIRSAPGLARETDPDPVRPGVDVQGGAWRPDAVHRPSMEEPAATPVEEPPEGDSSGQDEAAGGLPSGESPAIALDPPDGEPEEPSVTSDVASSLAIVAAYAFAHAQTRRRRRAGTASGRWNVKPKRSP